MESRLQDFLPVCPYCSRSLHQQEPLQLSCCHLICEDCAPKIQITEGYKCFFDNAISQKLHRPGKLTWLPSAVSQSADSLEKLISGLSWELGYSLKSLPCPFPMHTCQGLCGCDHSGSAKAIECPLKSQCRTVSSCLFSHQETAMAYNSQYATISQRSREIQEIRPMSMYLTLSTGVTICRRCQNPLNFCKCGGY